MKIRQEVVRIKDDIFFDEKSAFHQWKKRHPRYRIVSVIPISFRENFGQLNLTSILVVYEEEVLRKRVKRTKKTRLKKKTKTD